jgi:hypothetical protein
LGGEVREARARASEEQMNGARPRQPPPLVAAATPERAEDMTLDQLRGVITAGLEQPSRTLAQARNLARLVAELQRRGDADAAELQRTLKLKLAGDIATVRSRKGLNEAIRFADGAYALYPDSPVLRKSVTQMRLAAAEAVTRQREVDIAQAKRDLIVLMDEERVDDAWPGAVEALLQRLVDALSARDVFVEQARIRIAVLYLKRAAMMRAEQRLAEAARMLERARAHGAAATSVAQEEQLQAFAAARQKAAQAERDKVAQLDSLKQKLLAQAQANEVVDALATLKTLRASLPKSDVFVAEQAPAAIGSAYLRMASAAAQDGRLVDAIGLVGRGRSVARFTREFALAQNRYERYRAIEAEITDGQGIDVERIARDFSFFAEQDPIEEAAVAGWMIRKVLARASSASNDKVTARLAEIARRLTEHQASLRGKVAAPSAAAGRS